MNQCFECRKTGVLRGIHDPNPREMPTGGKKKGPGRIKHIGTDPMHSVDDHLNGKSIFDGAEERFHYAPASLGSKHGVRCGAVKFHVRRSQPFGCISLVSPYPLRKFEDVD
jgi:hypothetical protein